MDRIPMFDAYITYNPHEIPFWSHQSAPTFPESQISPTKVANYAHSLPDLSTLNASYIAMISPHIIHGSLVAIQNV